jgi:hypothetical protein
VVVVVGAGIGFFFVSRRQDPPPAAPPVPEPPRKLEWVPTARRSSSHDAYGALAPGSLEDRAPRH